MWNNPSSGEGENEGQLEEIAVEIDDEEDPVEIDDEEDLEFSENFFKKFCELKTN